MSFHTFQGSQSATFTAESDSPRIVYESQVTQGEMTIQIYERNGQEDILIADVPVNESGVLDDLTNGERYKIVVTAQKARGNFSFKME